MNFAYTGFDKSGKAVRGSVSGASEGAARDALRARGVFVSDLAVAAEAAPGAPAHSGGNGRHLREITHFMKQLAMLVRTGTPVVDAVGVLEKQIKPGKWRDVIIDVRKRVEEGTALSVALEAHPRYFDGVCRSLVQAGESRGNLAEMLKNLADLTRQQLKVRSALVGAMIYPCLLLCISFAVVITMLVFVLPRFEGLFNGLGADIPPTTKVLMAMGQALRSYWWAALFGLGAIVGGVGLYLRSEMGRRQVAIAMVKMPKVGGMVRSFITARIARLLGVLLEGKVSLIDALHLTRQAAGHVLYAELLAKADDVVTRGLPLSDALGDTTHGELITLNVVEAVRSGERTGQVGPVLVQLADFMDEDNEVVIKSLASIIEPLILVVLGGVVGLVAVSMFLPLFDLTSGAGGAG